MKNATDGEGSSARATETSNDERTISPVPGQGSAEASSATRPRIGPYEVVRLLVEAPGARILEARDGEGHALLLQLARVRAPGSERERSDLLAYLGSVQLETESLEKQADIGLMAHGQQEEPDGTRTLYWALAWREGATRLGHAAAHIRSPEHLLTVALALAERVRDRQAGGLFDPLLSEALVLVEPAASASFVGVPIHLLPEWLAEDIPGAAFAPEETLRRMPTKGGDLWRLGRALSAMAKELGELPSSLRALLDALADPDPMLRMASAAIAVTELSKLRGELSRDEETWREKRRTDSFPGREPPPIELVPESMIRPGQLSIADAPTITDLRAAGLLPDHAKEALLRHTEPAADETLRGLELTARDTIVDLTGPTHEEIARAKAQYLAAATGRGSDVSILDAVEQAAVEPNAAPGSPGSLEFREVGPGGTVIGIRRGAGPGGTVLGVKPRAKDVVGAVDAGPRDTVLGVKPRAREIIAGMQAASRARKGSPSSSFADTIALPVERVSARSRAHDPAADEDSIATDWRPGRGSSQIAVAVIAAATLAGGLVALVMAMFAETRAPERREGARAIAAFSEVVLQVTPPDAVVISENDGRILGRPPLSFLMPTDRGTPVLVTADGFEPQRILLPARGRIAVHLTPLDRSLACDIDLRIPSGAVVEPVAAKVDIGARTHLTGAVVLRAQERGAWRVACPALGGAEVQMLPDRGPQEEATLEITQPGGLALFIDGESVGATPGKKTLRTGFRVVRLEGKDGASVERWIPVEGDTVVEMPEPRSTVESPIARGVTP